MAAVPERAQPHGDDGERGEEQHPAGEEHAPLARELRDPGAEGEETSARRHGRTLGDAAAALRPVAPAGATRIRNEAGDAGPRRPASPGRLRGRGRGSPGARSGSRSSCRSTTRSRPSPSSTTRSSPRSPPPGSTWELDLRRRRLDRRLDASSCACTPAARTSSSSGFGRNFGKSAALAAGFERRRGDVVVTIDADLQDDPAEIPRLLASSTRATTSSRAGSAAPAIRSAGARLAGLQLADRARLTGVHAARHELRPQGLPRGVRSASLRIYGELHRFIPVLAASRAGRRPRCPSTTAGACTAAPGSGSSATCAACSTCSPSSSSAATVYRPLHLFGGLGFAAAASASRSAST